MRVVTCEVRGQHQVPPAFPQPLSAAFSKIYPLLTMLNAIAVSGRKEYLGFGKDRLEEARSLWVGIAPVERTHMGLYYIIALHNLGCLDQELPDLDAFVESVVNQWKDIDPGQSFFLHGICTLTSSRRPWSPAGWT